jgi:nucleotide-binding universal stress UspA family protein
MKKILVAIDGSKISPQAVHKAIDIAKRFESEVTLLKVAEVPTDANYADYQVYVSDSFIADRRKVVKQKIEQDKKMLDAILYNIDTAGIKVEKKILAGIAYEQIVKLAKEGQYDLIVMGRRGLSPIRRFFVGSVTQTVIAEAPCPVLVVKE